MEKISGLPAADNPAVSLLCIDNAAADATALEERLRCEEFNSDTAESMVVLCRTDEPREASEPTPNSPADVREVVSIGTADDAREAVETLLAGCGVGLENAASPGEVLAVSPEVRSLAVETACKRDLTLLTGHPRRVNL